MNLPSSCIGCQISNGMEGIGFFGNTLLDVSYSDIHNNTNTGINFTGQTITGYCGKVNNNRSGLISLSNEIVFSQSMRPVSGQFDFSGNYNGISFSGEYLHINKGKNDFTRSNAVFYPGPIDIQNFDPSIWVTWGASSFATSTIYANENKWDDNFYPLSNIPIHVSGNTYGNYNVNYGYSTVSGGIYSYFSAMSTMVDNSPISSYNNSCPTIQTGSERHNATNFMVSPMDVEGDLHNPEIGTPILDFNAIFQPTHEYQNYSTQDAVVMTLNEMYFDSTAGRYSLAASRLADILLVAENFTGGNSGDQYVAYLLDYAYFRMMEAIGFAIRDEYDPMNTPDLVDKVMDVQWRMIDQVENNTAAETDPYHTLFNFNYDVATTYWMMSDYENAMEQLNDMLPSLRTKETAYVNYALCVLNYENQALLGNILPWEETELPCAEFIPIEEYEEANSVDEPLKAKLDELKVNVYPNPAHNQAFVSINLDTKESVSIEVYNTLGELLSKKNFGKVNSGKHDLAFELQDCVPGTYLCVMKIGNLTLPQKLEIK